MSGLEAHRAAATPRPLSSRALHHPREGTTRNLATVAEVESAALGFGDRSSATASRPITGVIDETRTRLQLIHNQPAHQIAFDHHERAFRSPEAGGTRVEWSHRPDSNGHHRATRAAVCRLTYGGSRTRTGAIGANRTRYLRITNAAFSQQNFDGSFPGADDRARTDTFSLTRRAHCLSCSIRAHIWLAVRSSRHTPAHLRSPGELRWASFACIRERRMADPTGFEPAISCVTGRRGRPGSSMSPLNKPPARPRGAGKSNGCGHGS